MTPEQRSQSGLVAADNKNATRSMWLGIGSAFCCAFTGVPAIVLGIAALRSGNPSGRTRAWVGIAAGALFTLAWTGMWMVGRSIQSAQEATAQAEAQRRQEEVKFAHQKAEKDAPRRIEEARAAAAAGQSVAAVQAAEWLRSFGLEVPQDLHLAFAKDRIAKAKSAFGERRWLDAQKLASDAKGADAVLDTEADQLIAKASTALERNAAAEKRATEKAAAEKAASEKKARTVSETCAQVSRMFGADSSLSDLQKDEAWKDYKGKEFTWRLEFVEAGGEPFGSGFAVHWKCAENSPSLISDLIMTYPKADKSYVLSLKKGYSYKVDGRLTHTSTLIGLSAEPLDGE